MQILAGEKLEIVRRVIMTQAWGVAAIGLILTFAQVSLNRSLILVFLILSTGLLLAAKAVQGRLAGPAARPGARAADRRRVGRRGGPVRTAARAPRRALDRRSGGARGPLRRRRDRRGGADGRRAARADVRVRRRVRGGGNPGLPAGAARTAGASPAPARRRDRRQQRLCRLPAPQARGRRPGRQGDRRSRAGGDPDRRCSRR